MTPSKDTTNRRDLERYIRVDHAGERAAQQIYRGQLVVLGKHPMGDEIRHMMAQEVEHLEAFEVAFSNLCLVSHDLVGSTLRCSHELITSLLLRALLHELSHKRHDILNCSFAK